MNLIEWAFHHDTPTWVGLLAMVASFGVFCVLVLLTIAAFAYGLWLIPLLIWIVAPVWLIARAYRAARKGGDA